MAALARSGRIRVSQIGPDWCATMGTRVRVGVVGQATGFQLIRVDLTAEEGSIRAELVQKAAEKLGVSLQHIDASVTNAFLLDGAPLDDMSTVEKDDTIWLAFDGGSWLDPDRSDGQSSSSPSEPAQPAQPERPASEGPACSSNVQCKVFKVGGAEFSRPPSGESALARTARPG